MSGRYMISFLLAYFKSIIYEYSLKQDNILHSNMYKFDRAYWNILAVRSLSHTKC